MAKTPDAKQRYFGVDDGQFIDKGHSIPLDSAGEEKSTWKSEIILILGIVNGAAIGSLVAWKGVELLAGRTFGQMLEAPVQSPTHDLAGLLVIATLIGEVSGMLGGGAAVKRLEQHIKNKG